MWSNIPCGWTAVISKVICGHEKFQNLTSSTSASGIVLGSAVVCTFSASFFALKSFCWSWWRMIWSPAGQWSKCRTWRPHTLAGGPSWLSGDTEDAFPQMEGAVRHKGDARSMRSGLGASTTPARRTTLIGLSFGPLSVCVSHPAIWGDRKLETSLSFFLIVLPYSSERPLAVYLQVIYN